MTKWTRVRSSMERAHDDLYGGQTRYSAEFYNYTGGSWDPDNDEFTGESRDSIGSAQIEIVPPAQDSTVEVDGTSLSWTTSIRFPESIETPAGWGSNWGSNWGGETIVDVFVPLGEDSDRPTEVEVEDTKTNDTELYELHGYSTELGSGMIMCRLVEQ